MKKIIVLALAAMCIYASSFARDAVFSCDDYDISVNYNDEACPGDAVFVRMEFSQVAKKNKVSRNEFSATTANLKLFVDGKNVRSTEFYSISEGKNGKHHTLLAGIPLSSWWTKDSLCSLKVTYNLYGTKKMEFELPFALAPKEFVKETIPLDDKNTAIKTDTSTKRMEQIAKLNKILETISASSVYSTKPFEAPTTSKRRTSYFADRRIYEYTNGKSSTSLHYGIDYGIPEGSTVTACADGRVVLAEDRVTTGYSVVIEHLPGLYSLYYHMKEMKVKEGDMVKSGDLIGHSGCTGLATGPHLHWEVRLNMEAVSPDFFTSNFAFSKE